MVLDHGQPRESEKPRHCGNASQERRKVRGNSSRNNRVGDRRKDDSEKQNWRKVMRQPEYSLFGPDEREDKSLQEWVDELLKNALAEDQTKEARERQKMEVEVSHSRRRVTWGQTRAGTGYLATGRRALLLWQDRQSITHHPVGCLLSGM